MKFFRRRGNTSGADTGRSVDPLPRPFGEGPVDLSDTLAVSIAVLGLESRLGARGVRPAAEVARHAEQLWAIEPQDPSTYGPQLGLVLAVLADLQLAEDDVAAARASAEAAVEQLLRHTDKPKRIQAALLLALTVNARVARLDGRDDEAQRAEQRASVIAGAMGLPPAAAPTPAPLPESEDPVGSAEALIEQGIALSRQDRLADAVAVLTRAEAGLSGLPNDGGNLALNRALARARWRLSMALQMEGESAAAVLAGRNALTNCRSVLLVLATRRNDDIAAEVATVFADMSEVFIQAGFQDEGYAVLDEAERRVRDSTHPALRRAWGTLLHNQAVASRRGMDAPGMTNETIREPLQRMVGLAGRAVEVRREMVDSGDAISWYELANSLRLFAEGCAMAGDNASAADAVAEALTQVQHLAPGPAVNRLRAELGVLVQLLERLAPGQLSRARAAIHIPW